MQALCSPAVKDFPPRRMVNGGLDFKRFDQVLAVLSKHGRMKLYDQDARVNILGGLPAVEPAIDAAMAAAIISSFYEVSIPPTTCFVGEVDLAGAVAS
jgi:DNA repair protein RadA/Sms